VYVLLLTAVALFTAQRNGWLVRHANIILLSELGIYLYRDVWPLATYTQEPADIAEGWLLWSRLGALALAAVAIPLTIPRKYEPLDPKAPSSKLHPEQTASLLSGTLYTYLTPMIVAANNTDHLKAEQLNPMPEYDAAHILAAKANKVKE